MAIAASVAVGGRSDESHARNLHALRMTIPFVVPRTFSTANPLIEAAIREGVSRGLEKNRQEVGDVAVYAFGK